LHANDRFATIEYSWFTLKTIVCGRWLPGGNSTRLRQRKMIRFRFVSKETGTQYNIIMSAHGIWPDLSARIFFGFSFTAILSLEVTS
jgi:hypothetical protein